MCDVAKDTLFLDPHLFQPPLLLNNTNHPLSQELEAIVVALNVSYDHVKGYETVNVTSCVATCGDNVGIIKVFSFSFYSYNNLTY